MSYLDRLRALKSENAPPPPTDKTDKAPTEIGSVSFVGTPGAPGPVAEVVGIDGGVVSGVFNLESPGLGSPGWRPRHEEHYHEA
jgi:hypothetical protein